MLLDGFIVVDSISVESLFDVAVWVARELYVLVHDGVIFVDSDRLRRKMKNQVFTIVFSFFECRFFFFRWLTVTVERSVSPGNSKFHTPVFNFGADKAAVGHTAINW